MADHVGRHIASYLVLPRLGYDDNSLPAQSALPLVVLKATVTRPGSGLAFTYASRMAMCKAFGCTNNKRKHKGKHFFSVPTPSTEERKAIAQRWLHNLGTGHTLKTFRFGRNSVVCEDHFHESCYEENMQARLMGYTANKRLKRDAVPTIFVHRTQKMDKKRNDRLDKRNSKKVKKFARYPHGRYYVSLSLRLEESVWYNLAVCGCWCS